MSMLNAHLVDGYELTAEFAAEMKMTGDCAVSKPVDTTLHGSAVASTGCETSYQQVDACMKRHLGLVSACQHEWELFRACYEAGKAFKKPQRKATAP